MKIDWVKSFSDLINKHNNTSVKGLRNGYAGAREISARTRHERKRIIIASIRYLRINTVYRVQLPQNFRHKHFEALIAHWLEQGIGPSQLTNNISAFRAFALWIGKPGMIRATEFYVKDPALRRRVHATTRDKTWTGQGIDVEAKLAEIAEHEPRVALQLYLSLQFGCRRKEACMLTPHADDCGSFLNLERGTKNGLARVVPITAASQRDFLELAKSVVDKKDHSLIPPGKTYIQWRNHVTYVLSKFRLTKKGLGVTAHGLRHEYANNQYEKLTGAKSPVKGQTKGEVDKDMASVVMLQLAADLGHFRKDITTCYTSSIQVMAREAKKASISLNEEGEVQAQPLT